MDTRPYTQNELLVALQKRDRLAFGALYDGYAKVFLGIIARQCPEAALAEEILQQCFIRIWTDIEGYNPGGQRLLTWMLEVVKSVSAEMLRAREAGGNHEIQKAAKNLNENEALPLIYYEGYTLGEAARLLNMPVSELKRKLRAEVQLIRTVNAE